MQKQRLVLAIDVIDDDVVVVAAGGGVSMYRVVCSVGGRRGGKGTLRSF